MTRPREGFVDVETEQVFGRPRLEVSVVPGNGKRQTNSYVWIGEAGTRCYATMNRRQMRKLRDALTNALGERTP